MSSRRAHKHCVSMIHNTERICESMRAVSALGAPLRQ